MRGDLAVGIADVEHQHLVAVRFRLGTVEEPELAGDGAGVEEVGLELLRIEGAQQLAEHSVVEFLILALGQHAPQALVVGLDGLHGFDDRLGAVGAVGQGHQGVELGLGLQEDGALLREILLGQWPGPAASGGQVCFDGVLDREIPAVGMVQEDQAHDRQKIFVAGVAGVGPAECPPHSRAVFLWLRYAQAGPCLYFLLKTFEVHKPALPCCIARPIDVFVESFLHC